MREQPERKSERLQDSLQAVVASCTTLPALLARAFMRPMLSDLTSSEQLRRQHA